jgi:hypothetical protein
VALTIRKARRSDVDVIVSLSRELADHHFALARRERRFRPHLRPRANAARNFAARARKCIGARNAAILVAEVDNKPIGYCLIYLKQNPFDSKADKLGFIDHLIVTKNFQGRG